MSRTLASGVLAFAVLFGTVGCTSLNKTQQGVLSGAAIGTAAGVGVAAIAAAPLAVGAVVGGAVGAVAGGLYGHEQDKKQEAPSY